MWYKPGVNVALFQNTFFEPIFTPVFTPAEEVYVQQLCGSNANCRLDYAATRNDAVANATALTSLRNSETSSFMCEFLVP